jgi:hypothetical protein
MKIPDYNASSAKWDRYRRFHNEVYPWFVRFESGEAIITKASFTPHERRTLRDSDLQIVLTSDDDCPSLRVADEAALAEIRACGHEMAGKPVPKVWLQVSCSQTLLVDKTTGRVVRLDTNRAQHHAAWKHTPTWIYPGSGWASNAVAYLPGNDRDAIANKVRLKVPVKPSKESRRARAELRAGCAAWCTLANDDVNKFAPKWYATEPRGYAYAYIYHRPFTPKGADDVPDITDLSGEQRFQIARFGYATLYKYLSVDSLQVTPN